MSSGSKARMPSDRHGPKGGGSACSTEEAGQCPWREEAEQDSLLDEGYTAAPEAEPTVSTKLAELVARARKEKCLTNVIQFVDEDLLHLAFRSLRKQAAPGVDGQSYEDYAANLDQNLKDVHARLTTGRYKAPVIRRVYIPKGNGKRRPIGSPHTALHRLREGARQHQVRYVVESDLQSYFDTVGHAWLRTFVRHRVNDGGLIRLLDQWLKAGVMENGVVTHLDEGVPQGGPVSPVLSNVYLHYVLDLWFERRFKKTCGGFAELTRFADDYVATFQYH